MLVHIHVSPAIALGVVWHKFNSLSQVRHTDTHLCKSISYINCTGNPIISSVTASPVIISANSLLILNCTGLGPPETSTNWYLNGARLDPESDSNVMVQADGMLIVSDASISYTGTYFCNVSTSFAFVLSSVEVIVGGKNFIM